MSVNCSRPSLCVFLLVSWGMSESYVYLCCVHVDIEGTTVAVPVCLCVCVLLASLCIDLTVSLLCVCVEIITNGTLGLVFLVLAPPKSPTYEKKRAMCVCVCYQLYCSISYASIAGASKCV